MNLPDKIENLAVVDLVPYARNARTHTEKQVDLLARSMKEFGFTNPILVDREGGIVAGHGRVLAAKRLGLDAVPCLRVDWLNEAQKKAYVLADNKMAMHSGWDKNLLANELRQLEAAGFDLLLTGFEEEEFAEMTFNPDEGGGYSRRSSCG
jgi:hypothetical protein